MKALIDNDVIINLAHYSLWAEFDRLLRSKGFAVPYLCLGSARFVFQRNKPPSRMFHDAATQQEAIRIVAGCARLGGPYQPSLVDRLARSVGIDAGEALLIDYAIAHDDAVVFTGDKRCVRTLANESLYGDLLKILAGRFVQFDRVIQSLSAQFGWTAIRKRICDAPARDPSLTRLLALDLEQKSVTASMEGRIRAFELEARVLANRTF